MCDAEGLAAAAARSSAWARGRAAQRHVRLVGLGDIDLENAAKLVRSELPDATDEEVKRIKDQVPLQSLLS